MRVSTSLALGMVLRETLEKGIPTLNASEGGSWHGLRICGKRVVIFRLLTLITFFDVCSKYRLVVVALLVKNLLKKKREKQKNSDSPADC